MRENKCIGKSSKLGVTIVEIVLVVTIVAILTVILCPVFAESSGKSRVASCQNNLRQIGLAIKMYAQDWDGNLPWTYNWSEKPPKYMNQALEPYIKNKGVWKCPAQTTPAFADYEGSEITMHYAANSDLFGQNSPDYDSPIIDLKNIRDASGDTIAVFDWRAPSPACGGSMGWAALPDLGNYSYFMVHNGYGNFLFLDGHVKLIKAENVTRRMFSPVKD